ncbi:MAG: hypothetical protein OCD76_23175, partial [Reichenbachiella sp.]
MKRNLSITILILILCSGVDLQAQVTLPYYQDFESVADTTYTPDELVLETLEGLEGWSYEYAPLGRGALELGSIDNNFTQTMILTRRIDGPTANYANLTLDLSTYSALSDDFSLDFRFSHFDASINFENKVLVRGDETSDWIELYKWYDNRESNNEWVTVSGLAISDSLSAYGQDYSATFQLCFREGNFHINDWFAIDDIKVYRSPFGGEGRSGSITPSNGSVAYFGLGENASA